MVEHSTADREVPGSNPGAPLQVLFFSFRDTHYLLDISLDIKSRYAFIDVLHLSVISFSS